MSYTIAMRAPAEDVRRAHDHGKPNLRRDGTSFLARGRRAARRLRDLQLGQERRKALPVLGQIDRVRRRAQNPDAGVLQRQRELERRLAAELHQAGDVPARRALRLDDRHHVLEGQRLEVQPIGRVVVGRDRLRVAVDHHRLETLVSKGEGGMAAAVVELDALPDPVRSAAEDDHLVAAVRDRTRSAVRTSCTGTA